MPASKPLDWIKTVDAALVELDEVPQFGQPKPFPQIELEQALQTLFESPSLKLGWNVKGWTPSEESPREIDSHLLPLAIVWAPLTFPVCFVMPELDLKGLMNELLKGERRTAYFAETQLVEGFYHYLAAEVLFQITNLPFAESLSPHIEETGKELYESVRLVPSFVVDVSLALNGKTFWGQVWLSEGFRSAWKSFFYSQAPSSLTEEMKSQILVDLTLDIGYCRLSLKEWKEVNIGDLVVLDHCTYDPEEGKGGVIVALNQKPLFRGRFKEGGIKLTDYPVYQEAGKAMKDEFDSEDEDLYGDLDEDSEFEDDEDLLSDEEEEETTPGLKQLTEETPSIALEELPIHLTVEAGRVRMTVEELMKLTPGNLIDLRVFPEQGVDLIVNGKKVGHGELIRMGEMLGVRILSLS